MSSIPESSAHALGVKAELLEELLRLCSERHAAERMRHELKHRVRQAAIEGVKAHNPHTKQEGERRKAETAEQFLNLLWSIVTLLVLIR